MDTFKDSFESSSCGKWILAGEHTVLRGGRALVFPLHDQSMRFRWMRAESEPLTVDLEGERGQELSLIFYGVLEQALKNIGKKREDLVGHLKVSSNLRLGAGLGASAALCVGVTKFLVSLSVVSEAEAFNFARDLENLFHGESSGVDIAVAIQQRPILFSRNEGWSELNVNWKPNWYLSYSGKRGVTAECVKKVKDLWTQNPGLGQKIDQEMTQSTELAIRALNSDEKTGRPLLAQSMDRARDAFFQWKLTDGLLAQHLQDLQNRGALAVKPTGSGGGGYALSLWDHPVSHPDLIPL